MRKIDLSGDSLADRHAGKDRLDATLSDMEGTDELLVLEFGDKIATASWIDGFLASLLQLAAHRESTRLLVIASSEDNREHISLVLAKRGLSVFAVRQLEELVTGDLEVLGHVTEGAREVLSIIQRLGEASVEEIAKAASTSVQAIQQRLNALLESRLIDRSKVGRAYVYDLPVMKAADELLVVA